MTPSELKHQVENAGHESHFFDRKTMSFFGDTMRNYGVRSATIECNYCTLEVWELFRRKAVKHGLKSSTYFDKGTFRRVFPKSEA